MKKFTNIVFAIAAAVLFLTACEKPEELKTPVIEITTTDPVAVAAAGGPVFISYTLENEVDGGEVFLTLPTDCSWITGVDTQTSGRVNFTVSENTAEEVREAELILEYRYGEETVSDRITLRQQGINEPDVPEDSTSPKITLGQSSMTVGEMEDIYSINYTITNPVDGGTVSAAADVDWVINFDYTTDGVVKFIVVTNPVNEVRKATVTVNYSYDGGVTSATFEVVQDASTAEPPLPGFDETVNITDPKMYLKWSNEVKGNLYHFNLEINGFNSCGYNVYLDLLVPVGTDGKIAEGTYRADAEATGARIIMNSGSYARYVDENYDWYDTPIVGGTVKFTSTSVELDVVVESGVNVKTTYIGNLDYTTAHSGRFPKPGTSLTGAADLTVDGAESTGQALCYQDYWRITVEPAPAATGAAFTLDLKRGADFIDGFAGTYTCSSLGEANTFLPGAHYFGSNSDFDNWGTVYYEMSSPDEFTAPSFNGTYAAITSGTVTVSDLTVGYDDFDGHYADCTITIDGADPDSNTVKLTFTGRIYMKDFLSSGNYFNF